MFAPVYFDHNATTPLNPRVLEGMLPYLAAQYGNASSRHEYGRAARRAIDEARQRVACAVGAHPTEVVFTSGGSEANNLFIKGAAACLAPGLIAISAIEHPCVREPAKASCTSGAPGASASSMSVTAGSSSYSTSISASAARADDSVSAATAATGSPA